MPLAICCEGCKESYLIREDLTGRKIRCDCGQIQTVPSDAPLMPVPTSWLDSSTSRHVSLGLLVLSFLVAGSVVAWVGLDREKAGSAEKAPGETEVVAADDKKPTEGGREEDKPKPADPVLSPGPPKKVEKTEPPESDPKSVERGKVSFNDREIYERLLHSVVWISMKDGMGNEFTGSGGVIHVKHRLIITNRHVVEDALTVQVVFPQRDSQKQLITNKGYYRTLLREEKSLRAVVLWRDKELDLAVLQLEREDSLPPDTQAIKLARRAAREAERVVSVGNPGVSDAVWVFSSGHVRSRVFKKYRLSQDQFVSAMSLETDVPINQGDSGSPLVNDQGQMVAVNNAGRFTQFARDSEGKIVGIDSKNLFSFAIEREEVLKVLDKVQKKLDIKREEFEASDVLPPPGATLQALLKQLDDTDLAKCSKAVDELDKLDPVESRRAIPVLVRALQRHMDEGFRRRVAEVLERIGPPVATDLDCLGSAIRINYKSVKLYVVKVLSQLQPEEAKPVIHVLVQAISDKDDEVRKKAVLALQKMGPAARAVAFQPLLKLSNDADEDFAKAGFDALILLGKLTPDEVDILIDTLKDAKGRPAVRWYAVDRLGELGPLAAKAVPVLATILRTELDEPALLKTIGAVRAIGDKSPDLGTTLFALVKSSQGDKVRLDALGAIDALELFVLSTSQILDLWTTEKSPNIKSALFARLQNRLGRLKSTEMAELLPLLRHKEPQFIKFGLDVVRSRKGEAADVAEDLAGLLKHGDEAVRRETRLALQAMGAAAKPALPKLLEVVKEQQKDRREQALVALVSVDIDPKNALAAATIVPVLLEALHPRNEGQTISKLAVHHAIDRIGQPAVDGIFTVFSTLEYRGKDYINYRKALFECLELLGPSCRSKANYEQMELLRKREVSQGYKDVYQAALKAWKAMEP